MIRNETMKIMVQNPDSDDKWFSFNDVCEVLRADRLEDVLPVLEGASRAADAGLYAVGFLTYEAAGAMDRVLDTHESASLPLAWFAICGACDSVSLSTEAMDLPFSVREWTPSMSATEYSGAVGRIKRLLESGDTYQVNFTFQLETEFSGAPAGLFSRMTQAQQARYGAFIETDSFAICSASPELFLHQDRNLLVSRPMKGTARRGMTTEEDRSIASTLHASPKDRAENVMIVDMIRNDMGRIAVPGTVVANDLYDVARYPTVWQMTSLVECRNRASFTETLQALFPCASITGAPKVRTMQVIKDLETRPRGVYTGCVGFLAPEQRMLFNVAIRTVSIDKLTGRACYGVGSGVVWDSVDLAEYEECLLKADVLTTEVSEFELLETLLWEPRKGFFLEEEHLKRLHESAEYFCFNLDSEKLHRELVAAVDASVGQSQRVRLRVARNGNVQVDRQELAAPRQEPWCVALAADPVSKNNRFLYHKTTNRAVYENARASHPECHDVILWNTEGEVTESTIANVVIEKAGLLITPPIECGLLAGTFRERLLNEGKIEEGVVLVDDLVAADKLFLINSVRKWMPARLTV
jgi:para-aminobenzoate synthetase/4-amino-4-deoxychorismate lyase